VSFVRTLLERRLVGGEGFSVGASLIVNVH
jgi:hypothetical protein